MAATATQTKPPPASFSKPSRPSSIPNGTSSPSPSLASKRPPAPSPVQNSTNGININANSMRASTRQRRESQRPSQTRTNSKSGPDVDGPRGVKRKWTEPAVRSTDYILRKFSAKPPSLIVHLHQTHWRFDQQDGSFRYESPMKIFLEHLRDETVPTSMLEELLRGGAQFYDGCLIVEVHDHRTSPSPHKHASQNRPLRGEEPFSIHNYNEHITPSPYRPFPDKPTDKAEANKENGEDVGPKAMAKTKSQDKPVRRHAVYTTVMHSTELSRFTEMTMLLENPFRGDRTKSKQAAAAAAQVAATNTGAAATPISAGGAIGQMRAPKRKRYMLEEEDFYEFEAEVLKRTEPPLILETASNFKEAQQIIKYLTHPLHNRKPPKFEGRKKTTAELAADEAQLAAAERLALVMDERLEPSHGGDAATANAIAAEGQNLVKGFEPDFSRFKKLEEIKKRLEEEMQQKKMLEAQEEQEKRAREQMMMQRKQQEGNDRQRQEQQQQQALIMQQRQAMAMGQSQMNGMPSNMMANQLNPQMMQQVLQRQQAVAAAQAAHGSPIVRNHTPSQSSPLVGNVVNSFQAQPLMHNMSTQGPGSPPRPNSAMMGPSPMVRTASQQQSMHGTPRMPNATPQMSNSIPRHMTPQPGMPQAGSPVSMHGTPMMANQQMMNTPQMNNVVQMNPAQLNPQQQQQMAMMKARQQANPQQMEALRRQQMSQAQQQAQNMQMSPNGMNMNGQFQMGTNSQQNVTSQASPHQQQQQQQQQQRPAQSNASYQQQLSAQMQAKKNQLLIQQQQQQQQAQGSQMPGQQHARPQSGQPGQPGQPGQNPQNANGMGHNMAQNQASGNMQNMNPQQRLQTLANHQASNPQHPQHAAWRSQMQRIQQQQQAAATAQRQGMNNGAATTTALQQQFQSLLGNKVMQQRFIEALKASNNGNIPQDYQQKYRTWCQDRVMTMQQNQNQQQANGGHAVQMPQNAQNMQNANQQNMTMMNQQPGPNLAQQGQNLAMMQQRFTQSHQNQGSPGQNMNMQQMSPQAMAQRQQMQMGQMGQMGNPNGQSMTPQQYQQMMMAQMQQQQVQMQRQSMQ